MTFVDDDLNTLPNITIIVDDDLNSIPNGWVPEVQFFFKNPKCRNHPTRYTLYFFMIILFLSMILTPFLAIPRVRLPHSCTRWD